MTSKDLITATSLFDRVVSILEDARSRVARSANTNAVVVNWLIGREIVRDLQGGDERAEYGRRVIDELSEQLTQKYGRGFSAINLRNFRAFYIAYSIPTPIQHISCVESQPSIIQHIPCVELETAQIRHTSCDELPQNLTRN
jgi:hypothetical protein